MSNTTATTAAAVVMAHDPADRLAAWAQAIQSLPAEDHAAFNTEVAHLVARENA